MSMKSEIELAEKLHEVLDQYRTRPVYKRMRMRLRDMGKNCLDEVRQFRVLQRACRESAELARDLSDAGLGDIANHNPLKPDLKMGRMVNAFNRMVERHWESY